MRARKLRPRDFDELSDRFANTNEKLVLRVFRNYSTLSYPHKQRIGNDQKYCWEFIIFVPGEKTY